MAKFKMKMELKLEIEGEREDIPLMAENLSQQLAGALAPSANIAEGTTPVKPVVNQASAVAEPPRKKKRKPSAKQNGTPKPEIMILNWAHDPEKWGNPQQTWTTAEKSIWLLYVIEQELGNTAVSASEITATFNQHFKQSKTLHPPNVPRDLGKLKTGTDAYVGEDTTNTPSSWFLTTSGKTRAQELVAVALGKPEGTGS